MTAPRFNTLLVRLPEGVTFTLPLAGPVTRFLAWSIDAFATALLFYILLKVLPLLSALSPDLSTALMLILFFVVPILYGLLFEWLWRGQTPGKRVLGLRVADAGGLQLRFSQVVLRNLLRAVDLLPVCYLLGGAACLLSRRSQRLGDLAADTVVLRVRQPPEPSLRGILAGKYNSLRDHPVLAARLRQRVGPVEAGVALQAVLRRDELDPPARVAIFAELAARLRAAVTLPEELAEGLTDEQLVRNAVDVIHRPHAVRATAPGVR